MAFQWYTSPIASDMTKQLMFDLVPFASARRIVTYFDRHAGFVGQSLQFIFPKSISMAVAPNAVCCHQKSLRFRVPLLAQLLPPATNRFHGKFTGVVTDANRHPCFVGFNIVNAVGNRFTKFLVRKVVRVDLQRFSFWAVLLASICLFSKNFFLFGINRYRRALSPLAGTDPASNVFKLCVAVGMVRALSSLAITLQRVSERTKNLGNLHSAHCVSLRAKLLLKLG
jgi:hypothetical protein